MDKIDIEGMTDAPKEPAAQAHAQSLAVAQSDMEPDDQGFIDATSDRIDG
jgi:hypothetical protein